MRSPLKATPDTASKTFCCTLHTYTEKVTEGEKKSSLHSRHYVEYLSKLVVQNEIDPAPIFDAEELEMFVKKAGRRLPTRYGITPEVWKDKVIEVNGFLFHYYLSLSSTRGCLPFFVALTNFTVTGMGYYFGFELLN